MGFFNVYTTSNSYLSDYFQYLTEQWSNADNTFTGAWNRDTGSASTIARVTNDDDMILFQRVILPDYVLLITLELLQVSFPLRQIHRW